MSVLSLLGWVSTSWASGAPISEIVEPMNNMAVTIQYVLGIIAALTLMVIIIEAVSFQGRGLVVTGIAFILLLVALKATNVLATAGPGRAIAATTAMALPPTLQQMLCEWLIGVIAESSVTLFVIEGIRRVRGRSPRV